ncbi:helix-turn-helix domain-containing protein [Umezakia ovalisporum]|uniref:helix-turn-helix domain-containing protein n=1 Tax=Umezakia ovalisporum TaxID=75695 RepID=UPI0006EF2A2C|nr:helix-turn-helix domain-containing protein [Umezakia ovalisporum]MDH6086225.1 helix-turn-helix domain-containing protein [Umezakia ovalisporum TAC611]MDH6088215.1 helix-turn-helix domain-containing protein [Umezakia ovalisporum Ak1311]CEJ46341.1 Putative uncharacterized protein [Umezakia ovalisporum]
MNKQEAADFLGVSVHVFERYVQQGRISVRYEKGKTYPTANFQQAELEAFKVELGQGIVQPAFESRQIATQQKQNIGIQVQKPGRMMEFAEIGLLDKLSSVMEGLLSKNDHQPEVPVADKLLLTMAEAQLLTGLSKEFLKDAITAGELNAKVIGRGWRIKRSDLNAYIDKLF